LHAFRYKQFRMTFARPIALLSGLLLLSSP
jgi:hypothetical protein